MTTVLGGGSWGTALAWLLGESGRPVCLWCRDGEQAERAQAERVNRRYLPGVTLPLSVTVLASLSDALAEATLVVLAIPTSALRAVLAAAAPHLREDAALLIAAKGLERETGLRVSEVAAAALNDRGARPIAVLSGPNLAGELVRRVPTTSV